MFQVLNPLTKTLGTSPVQESETQPVSKTFKQNVDTIFPVQVLCAVLQIQLSSQ